MGLAASAVVIPATSTSWRIGQRLSSKPEQPLESYSRALAWVERIGNEDLRRDAVPNMIQRWIQGGSPETAAAYFTEGGAAPANQRAGVRKPDGTSEESSSPSVKWKWIAITFVAALACGWWSGGLGQGGLRRG